MDFGQLAIDTLRAQGASTQAGIAIGRSQMAREVRAIIGTASARKPLDAVIQELLQLLNEEARK